MGGYPVIQCPTIPCPKSYMALDPSESKNDAPSFYHLDPSWGPEITQDPRGTGESFISYGMCPIDQSWDDKDLKTLALAKLFAFDYSNHGQFFWNFRTEIEPRWSYLDAIARGWLPRGPYTSDDHLTFLDTCNALLNPPLPCEGEETKNNPQAQMDFASIYIFFSLLMYGGLLLVLFFLFSPFMRGKYLEGSNREYVQIPEVEISFSASG